MLAASFISLGGGVIYFVIQFLEKAWPFNKTSFDLLHPTMLSAKCKFGKNWLCGSGEGVIYFVIQSLEKRVTLQLNKLRSPSSKDALCQMQVGKMSSLCFRYFSITLFEKKVCKRTDKLTDDNWSEKLIWASPKQLRCESHRYNSFVF